LPFGIGRVHSPAFAEGRGFMRPRLVLVCLIVLSLGLVACGDKDRGLKGEEACLQTPPPIAEPKFPAGFPSIDDVVWTASNQAGPTLIVAGRTGDALEDLFKEMKEKFSGGGYSVAKSERDPHDAEVNFTSASYTGQVQLAEECQGRRSVVIKVRPT
jgi:hypothetical protein